MSDAELQRQIVDDLKPTAEELARDVAAARVRMQKVVDELSPALAAKNVPLLTQHLRTLDGLMGDYARLVARGQALIARAGKLVPQDERSPAAKVLAALNKALGEQQGKLQRNWEKLKLTQAEANKVLAQAHSEAARLQRAWADMEAFLDTNEELFRTRLQQITALEELARGAVAERDAKELVQIQARNEGRKDWRPTASEIDQRLMTFFNNSGKQLPEALKAQFTADRIKFVNQLHALQATDKKIDERHKAIKALAIKPIDAKKAADAMEIPKGHEARVKKALESGPLVDALDALARELKLKVNGTDLLNRLKKAKLL